MNETREKILEILKKHRRSEWIHGRDKEWETVSVYLMTYPTYTEDIVKWVESLPKGLEINVLFDNSSGRHYLEASRGCLQSDDSYLHSLLWRVKNIEETVQIDICGKDYWVTKDKLQKIFNICHDIP